MRLTKEAYGWDPDAHFLVPDEVREHFATAAERGAEAEAEWNERLEAYRREQPELAEPFSLFMDGRLPDGWDAELPRFSPDDKPVATRKASNEVIQWVAAQRADAGQRLGRPRALHAHRDRWRRQRDPRRLLRPERALRRARARHGRGGERPEPPRSAGVRLHLLQLPRLHEGRGAPGGADAPAGDPRVHARLDRAGRGRARPTSRWSSWRTCAPRPTSTPSGRPTPTRPRWPGCSPSSRRTVPAHWC